VYISGCVLAGCIFHENLYTHRVHTPCWFPRSSNNRDIRRQTDPRQRRAHRGYLHTPCPCSRRKVVNRASPGRIDTRVRHNFCHARRRLVAARKRMLAIRPSKFRWSRLNPLPAGESSRTSDTTGRRRCVRPRARERARKQASKPGKSERKEAKVPKEDEGDQTLHRFPPPLSLSLSLSLSLIHAAAGAKARLIYVTIRHSILLYSPARFHRFDSEAHGKRISATPAAKSPAFRHSHPIRVCECARGIKYARPAYAYVCYPRGRY